MRQRGSKVWSALLAGAGGGGLALWACLPSPPPSLGPSASAPATQDKPQSQAPQAAARDRLEGVAIIVSDRVVVPLGVNSGWWFHPPSLPNARGWAQSNESLFQVGAEASPARKLQILERAYREASDPVVQQNLIFLVALSLPWEIAEPWLELRTEDEDRDSARDACWALAMSGSERFLRELEASPPVVTPRPVLVDSLREHEVLGLAGGADNRGRLLAYRALEIVDRAPYFKRTSLHVHLRWFPHPLAGPGRATNLTWIDESRAAPAELSARLWAAWIRSFPGHPGNDDVALRLGRLHLGQRRHLEAARWFSRASVLPDQDVTWGALNNLLATAEVLLGDAALDALVKDAELSGRNRELLQYVQVRRLAARSGCAQGLAQAAQLAEASPGSALAQAWSRRWSVAPPRGLASGVAPLDRDDPLQRRVSAPKPAQPNRAEALRGVPPGAHLAGQGADLGRLDPHPEAVALGVERLARQFRLWETIAELAEREAAAEAPDLAADLRYKRAAIFFHQPEALFPAYTRHRRVAESVVDSLWNLDPADKDRFEVGVTEFAAAAQGWTRAADLLAGFEVRYPTYPGLDEALFTRSLAFERLLRGGWCLDQHGVIRSLVGALEQLASSCPESPLSDDAGRAVSYWRSTWSQCFR